MGAALVLSSEGADRSGNTRSQAAPRFDAIDLLRGLSILGVMLLHASNYLGFSDYQVAVNWPKWLRYLVFNQGGNGVSAFFAISGFLITYVASRRFGSLAKVQVGHFYRIRFARIMPLLALLLMVLSLGHVAGWEDFRIAPDRGTLAGALFSALFFHLNWYEAVHGFLPPPWTVLWSLSVEEMFYLGFPLLCTGLLRRQRTRPIFFLVLIGLIVFGPFARQSWYSSSDIWLYQSYLGNVDNIAMGALFALLALHLEQRTKPIGVRALRAVQGAGILLTAFVVCWMWPMTLFGWRVKRALGRSGLDVTVLGLGVCLLMLASVLRNRRGSRWTAPLRFLGRLSYEVYLSHEFVLAGTLTLFLHGHHGFVGLWIGAATGLAGLLGWGLARFVSEPANRRLRGAPVPTELHRV